jgi:hypothetical protein
VETLEGRTLLTTTLYLDFGDAFPSGGLQMTVGQLRGPLNGPDLTDLGLADTDRLTFTPFSGLVNFDYNGDGAMNAADASQLRADIVSLVSRYYAPFDINVTEASAARLTDVVNTLNANNTDPTGHNDAYVFVAGITQAGNPIAQDLGILGVAAGHDIGGPNARDDSAVVFANNLFAFGNTDATAGTAVANVAAHEAGHTFGLRHTEDSVPGSDAEILTRSDIISQFADPVRQQNLQFFTRFPLPLAGNPAATENPYDVLANDADIGPRAGAPAYVTGTGADDLITLTRLDATHATVTVQPFRRSTYAPADQIGAAFSYTVPTGNGIRVEGGFGDDRVVVDGTLACYVDVAGMAGNDQLVVQGNGVASGYYFPGGSTARGLDGAEAFHGTVTAGTTTIHFDEFETAGSVTVQNIPNFTLSTGFDQGPDVLTVTSPAAGQDQVSGAAGGVSFVPLTTVSVGQLTLDTATNHTFGNANDQVTVNGLGSPVSLSAGAGDDTLIVDLAGGTPLPAGGLTFDGGTGVNNLVLRGSSSYNSESYTPSGATSGGIDLSAGPFVPVIPPPATISYSNVQQITDTLDLAGFPLGRFGSIPPSFSLNGTAAPDVVSVMNGAAVNNLTTLTVSGNTFAPVTFANKANLSFYGLAGSDSVTVNDSAAATGLATLLIDGGTEGDTVNVQQTAAGVPVTVNGGDGNDVVNIGNVSKGNLSLVRGPVAVNGQNGKDTVNLLDDGAGSGDAYTITDTTVGRPFFGYPGSNPPVAGLTYGTIENLVLRAAAGDNAITVTNLTPATAVTVDGGGGTDTLVGPNFINTWALKSTGPDLLTVLLDPATKTVGHVSFSAVENLTGGSNNDTFQFGPGARIAGSIDGGNGNDTLKGSDGVNTWELTGLNAGDLGDASGSSTFTRVENLVGGLGNDTFRFLTAGAGVSGTLNGNGGTDWLDYSTYPGAVTVNLETGTATRVGVGAANPAGHVVYLENVVGARSFANTLTGASAPLGPGGALNALGNALGSVLIGGDVADVLTAGAGNSILIGRRGADTLIASAGTPGFDILIAGLTDFDNPTPADLSVLNALAGVWQNTTAANYRSQVALLRDTGVTVGGTTNRLNGSSVHDDAGAVDTLTGATGAQAALDWFFANLGSDRVQNPKGPEVVTPII